MPFQETCRMEQRVRMLSEWDSGEASVSELCRRYGVSRDVFYHWRARRASGASDWFLDRSHAPLICPHRTPREIAERVMAMKRRFMSFGPKKILARLAREDASTAWPAASTIGDILKTAGLTSSRGRRRRAQEQGAVIVPADGANAEWCVDFKGWFRTRDGSRCDPLTIMDSPTRYLIEVRIAPPTLAGVRPVFERVFCEYGLPGAIRCDNGPPFGSVGAGGLSRLSVWWLKLGIVPHYLPPASPQHNGAHERMHRTLKRDAIAPAAASARAQQRAFDAYRRLYNHDRPHEALAQRTPSDLWRPSERAMPARLAEPVYDEDKLVRRVRSNGEIKWRGGFVLIGQALIGERVGLAETTQGHLVQFFDHDLGVIDFRGRFRRFAPLRHRLREAAKARPELSTIFPV